MIKIVCFVDSFKYFKEPIDEFLNRLGKQIELVKLKPSKKKEISEIIKEETLEAKKYLEKQKGYKILLFIEGQELTTLQLLIEIEYKLAQYGDIIFIIGGAYGLDALELKKVIDYHFSIGRMTFSHIEVLMILLEQIYRISCIKKGINYHH